jgi:hypothetical protein
LALLLLLFLVAAFKRQKWYPLVGVAIVTCTILYFWGQTTFDDVERTPVFFLRYPFINYWFFAIVPKLASLANLEYHEIIYRIAPLVSMIGVAWVYQRKINSSHPAIAIAWGLAVATIPNVFYYSSILYIEPPAVFLMTIACLDIRNLLHKDPQELVKLPAWYALIFIGFVKETTVPFLVCFVTVRMIVQLSMWVRKQGSENSWPRWAGREIGVAFAVLAPAVLYLYFRMLLDTRSFTPNILNLLDPGIYPVILRALFEQYGVFFLFFLGGCLILWKERDYSPLAFYLLAILAMLTFHILDSTSYVGYSRFNLFLAPPIFAGALKSIQWVMSQKRLFGAGLVAVTIGSNLLLSPVHWDGVKTASWGNYLYDTSEHYYPYQDALLWLKNNEPNKRVLFTGQDFYYPFQFYWSKLDWKPRKDGIPTEEHMGDEQTAIADLLEFALRENYPIVVYRVLDEDLVLPTEIGEFHVQVIQNSSHRLIIFHKP